MPMSCPVCQFPVTDLRGLAAHFRHQAATHPDYTTWADDRRWEGKVENDEFVRCRECGFRSESLARHLKSAHGMTADEYRSKHGRDALVRNLRTEERRREGIKGAGQDRTGTKVVVCPDCEAPVEVHKHAGSLHDFRCAACKAISDTAAQEGKWEGKVEGTDFVTCLDCGYRNSSHNLSNRFSRLLDSGPGTDCLRSRPGSDRRVLQPTPEASCEVERNRLETMPNRR